MKLRFPEHALEEIEQRGLDLAAAVCMLDARARIVEERFGRRAYQSRVNSAGGEYPVRALIDPPGDPPVVLTASRTSRIAKNRRTRRRRYDLKTGTLRPAFRSIPVHEGDEDRPGVILGYGREVNVVGIEILDASKRVENPQTAEFVAGAAKVRIPAFAGMTGLSRPEPAPRAKGRTSARTPPRTAPRAA